MEDRVLRKLFLGFIQIHLLHHASKEPIYGSWMMDELRHHGYDISPGTLYPIFHSLEKEGHLVHETRVDDGRMRKYYRTTPKGDALLAAARDKALELVRETEGKHVSD
ncbi:PadR family transcriptional regulator [Anoxynatronum buryatiense]|uniref:DNA-binding transcriptional regulator, PadR family n=1 Tax=Anoxynatronum buryatiense TaxID=489973 RepID=A0AA46AJN1_9CLOT|nr:PadR family transcriptional regulator [Anoxynatronum buryatiense]SMP62760.1 DNA-binding transcriptional regulator, PadR family [Anoxynatronum buryatiense]